jgi:hypothetical protein
MRFWLRELGGWLLVLLGLYLFMLSIDMLYVRMIFEAPPVALIGIIVFRGGIHLLKVAVAARVCTHAQAALREQGTGVRGPVKKVPGYVDDDI